MPIIRASQRRVEESETSDPGTMNREEWISEPGGLTQFGTFVQVLAPGTRSSIKHWHKAEDELVLVLEGQVTVVEGDAEHLLGPGDAATFPQGSPVGHYLWNRTASPVTCIVVGTRAPIDQITYPDHDRVMHRDRSQPDDRWTDLSGNPATNPYARWLP
ncbi:cupin domain-containing protein [Rugamonas apoptosis]|uniref:Cupin domain-containing protein n=1 Tax=Rugamonas apoptosis TaxID=2758570 RepID=A0A7W2IK10_9BURK|nr:cupin domain-containing protein [Rugamonas apoptosis]MBA5686836.1 cupin domain-containing protein [Rugamonas apoptosis]